MHQYLKSIILAFTLLHFSHVFAAPTLFKAPIANDDSVSIKSDTLNAIGNVLSNDTGGDSASLLSSPAGNYGSLTLSSTGAFIYSLQTNLAVLVTLPEGQVVSDVFTYSYKKTGGFSATAKLTIQIVGNPSALTTAVNDNSTLVLPADTTATISPLTIDFKANDVNAGGAVPYLVSNSIGLYGYLDTSSAGSGVVRYILDESNVAVKALSSGKTLTDTFSYRLRKANQTPQATDSVATITIQILSQREGVNEDNVEVEPNNSSKGDPNNSTIGSATPLNSGQFMQAQLSSSSDRDWFFISSVGSEKLYFELCPQGTSCYNQKAWVMYIFDGELLTDTTEKASLGLNYYVKDLGSKILSTYFADNMYLLYRYDFFQQALVGIIDPCFGSKNTVTIGTSSSKQGAVHNYFVAIGPPLKGDDGASTCGGGNVVLEKIYGKYIDTTSNSTTTTTTPGGTDTTTTSNTTYEITQQFVTVFPNSDDQYTFKYTRDGTNPLAIASSNQVTYNSATGIAIIPKVRVGNQLYSAQLRQINGISPATFDIVSLLPLNDTNLVDPYVATYNPANQLVQLPRVTVEQTGLAYTVELLYLPISNRLQLKSTTLIN